MAGLFRGLGPTIVTNAPYSAFYYLFYTSLQQGMQQVCSIAELLRPEVLIRLQGPYDPSADAGTTGACKQYGASKTATNFTAGTVAAVCATLLTQPTGAISSHPDNCAGGRKYHSARRRY